MLEDIIRIILKYLDVCDIHSVLLVNREWCRAVVPIYWKAPFSFTKKRSVTALKIYEMFLEQGNITSAQGEAQKVLPFFDYPSFIKELNYTSLLACKGTYERIKTVELILQMLTDREIRLETFIMENTGANNERAYGLWTTPCYAPIFSTLIHVEIHTPFPKSNVIKSLAKNCTRLSHLDINLHDTSDERAKESVNYLEELISAQKRLLNLRLVFPNGPGNMLIKAFQSRLESFQRLELVKWNFSGCDWSWLNNCPNLIEFAITTPPPQVSRIFGAGHETYRSKPSKNSKILTEHWHFDKGDEISSMPKFYFHSGKSLMAPHDGESPTVIKQPKVVRYISKEKLRQYQSENFLRTYSKMINRLAREEAEEAEEERRRRRRQRKRDGYDYDSDDFDFEDYFGMTEEQWYNCYDPSD
ncbi:4017_t:CDS:2 [Diversispora eburnea]|uniref:4017_t:CDS:1 n=1 Tax=Diversispora eburnea TaxID=1213867 RepID=A0A9N9BZE2_9GLOM|nr:4017_t:CDS:2 [Diversispora eburnea]